MDRLKTFLKYIIWILLFWLISNFLIEVGLNSSYKAIENIGNTPAQINIYQAEATLVNGRIKGTIKNNVSNNIAGKYIKLDLYSKQGNKIGCRYLDIGQIGTEETKPIEIYFKIKEVQSYSISIVDNKEEESENLNIEILGKDFTLGQIVVATAFTLLILW